MKRVGILTHYYHNNNYGGNLQAYALATYINMLDGYEAEQIAFQFEGNPNKPIILRELIQKKTKRLVCKMFLHPKWTAKKIIHIASINSIKCCLYSFINSKYRKRFDIREAAIRSFNECKIPHSKSNYSQDNISASNALYDIFVVGSDQVWSGCSEAFALGFVEKGKGKLSYAASISRQSISEEHSYFLRERLRDYDSISVRDVTDFQIVSKLTSKDVQIVLDPAFLLTREEWDKIVPARSYCDEPYVFCYYLGNSESVKKLTKKFAKEKGLKLITLPHFIDNSNAFIKNDFLFGDIQEYAISPADFVGLIKNAEYVFTDSFHAAVFSLIFQKEFFVFDRVSKWGNMSTRIINLLSQFDCIDHFCSGEEKETVLYLTECKRINYSRVSNQFENAVANSKRYLVQALKNAGQ